METRVLGILLTGQLKDARPARLNVVDGAWVLPPAFRVHGSRFLGGLRRARGSPREVSIEGGGLHLVQGGARRPHPAQGQETADGEQLGGHSEGLGGTEGLGVELRGRETEGSFAVRQGCVDVAVPARHTMKITSCKNIDMAERINLRRLKIDA